MSPAQLQWVGLTPRRELYAQLEAQRAADSTNEPRVNLIETTRLLLEPLETSRLEDFVALTADPATMRYWRPDGPLTRDAAERNFVAALARLRELGFGRRWLVSRATGAGLGFVDTKYFGNSCEEVSPDEVEIGWMLTPSAWATGMQPRPGARSGTRRSTGSSSRASLPYITPRTPHPDGSWRSWA